jgi:hypothetical protein
MTRTAFDRKPPSKGGGRPGLIRTMIVGLLAAAVAYGFFAITN